MYEKHERKGVATLGRDEAREVAKQFGLRTLASWSKGRLVSEISRKLTEQKGSAIRIAPIMGR